jgi:hypothetical protein
MTSFLAGREDKLREVNARREEKTTCEPSVSSQFQFKFLATMKFSLAILSLAATASAFTVQSPARSVARVSGSSVLAPVPVRAAGT